nr:centrosomal protein of 68 kDa [Pogona vitticeps]
MALVEKSPLDVSLNVKTKGCGQWNYMDLEMEYPELIRRGCQPLAVKDGRRLLRAAEDEGPAAVEEADHEAPGIPEKNQNPSTLPLMPSSGLSKIKAKATYVESQPLIDGNAQDGDVPLYFSRGGLWSEEQQRVPAERSASAEVLDTLLGLPGFLPARGVDSTFCSRTTRPLHDFDIECRGRMLLPPHSSTPKHLSSKRNAHLGATMPVSPRTSISLQLSEDGDFKQQEMVRSKSFSTVAAHPLSETSVPWNLHSRFGLKRSSMVGTAKRTPLDSCSLVERIRKMSSFQADYWACAIPDCLPPSPDRQSPHWDPNKEYEDLLDYTYPLRPKHKLAKKPNDSTVHDSGVDLDSLSVSPESSLKFLTVQDQEQQTAGIQSTERCSIPSLKKLECPSPISRYRLSPVGKVSFMDGDPSAGETGTSGMMTHGLSPRCLSPDPSGTISLDGRDWNSRGHEYLTERDATSNTFIRSTRMLPLQTDCSGGEEYLSLPPRLKELEALAQQLTDLSLSLTQPEHQHIQDDFPSLSVKREQRLPKVYGDYASDKSQWEPYCDSCHTSSFREHAEENVLNKQGCKDQDSMPRETASHLAVRCLEFPGSAIYHVSKEKDNHRDSLAQRIKIFCGQLEELIHRLHKIAEVTGNWIPPRPDIESVKTSLQNYLEFKKDLAGHQALTECVLQDGDRLLKHMASDSPVLQSTLGLIAKQSSELENDAGRLHESIVAAMDALGATLMKNHDAQQIAAPAKSSK